jgi:hypothetical protein
MVFLPIYAAVIAQTTALRYKKTTVKLSNQTYKTGANGTPLGFCGLPVSFPRCDRSNHGLKNPGINN